MSKYLLFVLIVLGACHPKTASPHQWKAFEGLNIVDLEQGEVLKNQVLVIKDSTLHFVGSQWDSLDYYQIIPEKGNNHYVIPALWDMHTHLLWEQQNDSLVLPALLNYGITRVRDMGGDLAILELWKSRHYNIEIPEIFAAGPIVDGNPPLMSDFTLSMDSTSDISYLLDSLYNHGASFTKTYSLIKDRELRLISEHLASKKRHFAGHLSEYIEPELSIDLGMRSVEHLNRLEDLDTLQLERVIHKMVKNNTWLCPTLIIYHNKWALAVNDLRQPDLDATIHPQLNAQWERSLQNNSRAFNEIDFIKRLELVKHLHDSGIPLLAGSDFAGMPFVYPGRGLHQELVWLQKAGLTPAEVLSTCTINPAQYWGITDLGLIKPGYQAEFVILEHNPLDDISNISSITQVYRKGQLIVDLDTRNH